MKDLWWIQFVFLFLFLLAGGIYSWHMMKKQAQNLVGGSNYQDLSSHSRLMERNGLLFKLWTFFASDEEISKSIAFKQGGSAGSNENPFSSDDEDAAKQLAANDMAEENKDASTRDKKYSKGLFAKAGTDTKIPKIISSLPGISFGGGSSSTSGLGDSANKSVSLKDVGSFSKKGNALSQGTKTSALESLKAAHKSSLQGTREASGDTARNWIAKSFDASGDPRKAIAYNEKVRKSFDKINPNSIPNYLRDEKIDLTNVESLRTPDPNRIGNIAAEKEALEKKTTKQMEREAELDMMKDIMSSLGSVINSGFSNPQGSQSLNNTNTWRDQYSFLCNGQEYSVHSVPLGAICHVCRGEVCTNDRFSLEW